MLKSYSTGRGIKNPYCYLLDAIWYTSPPFSIQHNRTVVTNIHLSNQINSSVRGIISKNFNHQSSVHHRRFSTNISSLNPSPNDTKAKIETLASDLKIDVANCTANIELIKSFEADFSLISEHKRNGKFNQAIVIAERVYQILLNATGPYSTSTTAVLLLLITFYHYTSNVAKIEETVFGANMSRKNDGNKSLNKNLSQYSVEFQIKALLLLALSRVQNLIMQKNSTLSMSPSASPSSSTTPSSVRETQKNFYETIVNLAITEVDLAIALCETVDTKVSNNDFSACYGLKGLLCMMTREYVDAEMFLQMSARWSSNSDSDSNIGMMSSGSHEASTDKTSITPSPISSVSSATSIAAMKTAATTQSMIALSNLGAFIWLVPQPPINFSSSAITENNSSPVITASDTATNTAEADDSNVVHKKDLIIANTLHSDDVDADGVFNPQKLQQNFKSLSLLTSTATTTATNATVITSASNKSSSQPSSTNSHLSLDDEKRIKLAIEYWKDCLDAICIIVKPSSTTVVTKSTTARTAGCGVIAADTNTKSTDTQDSLSAGIQVSAELLSDVDFSTAYSTLLCNLAEATDILNIQHPSATTTANDSKLINATKTVHSSQLYLITALKALEPHQLIYKHKVSPYFSRVLGLIGYQHTRNSQAVSAEGLFRSAMDEYKNNHVITDPRHAYELAIIKGRLGLLYSKWDKRESQAEALIQEANESIDMMKKTTGIRSNINLSQTIQYPLYFL